MAMGAGVAALYVLLRVASSAHLTAELRRAYPSASSLHVFPSLFGVTSWRYVARLGSTYAAGPSVVAFRIDRLLFS